MNERENHMLEGFKRGKSTRDILTCRQVLNMIVFLGFMVNYMLRVNLTFAIVDMVTKRDGGNVTKFDVNSTLGTAELNRTTRSLHWSSEDLFQNDDELELSIRNRRLAEQSENSNNYTLPFSNLSEMNNTPVDQYLPSSTNETSVKRDDVIRFTWSEPQVGYILGSFFWGYLCTEIPGGRLAEVIGARKVFGYATLGASVLTLLAPMCAKISFVLLLVNRIVMGAFLGPTWPAILPLASKWIPTDERGKFLSNMMASTLGAAFTMPICGFIIDNSSWEYVFYFTGLVGFIWSICWFLLVYDSPAIHPRISDEERFYIESKLGVNAMSEIEKVIVGTEKQQVTQALIRDHERNIGHETCDSDATDDESRTQKSKKPANFKNGINDGNASDVDEVHVLRSPNNHHNALDSAAIKEKNVDIKKESRESHSRAPWLSILTSVPVWAFVFTHGSSVFGYHTITNQLPTFMKHILNYNIKENGILSGLPYLGKYISAVIGGFIADYLIRSSTLSRNTVRKMFTCIGVMVPGFIMVMQIFLGSNKILSIVIFTLTLAANGFVTGGYIGNSLELAPNYSGTIFGLANMLSGLCGTLSALLVGWLTENNQVYSQWQKVFAMLAISYISGALIFLFLGSTKTQPWDSSDEYRKSTNRGSKQKRTER